MTSADTQDLVTPADSRNGEAWRLCVQRMDGRLRESAEIQTTEADRRVLETDYATGDVHREAAAKYRHLLR